MPTYTVRQSLQNDAQASATREMKKMGVLATAQNFVTAYMSPSDQGDLHNRLGTLISTASESVTVSDYSFPPFNVDSTHTDLGIRIGGFKQLNDQINKVQNLYRLLTGEIRTKITEWDLSLYLQEPGWATYTSGTISYLDENAAFDLSLLYRIFLDNPSGYHLTPGGTTPDTRALIYGLINASLHYQYKSTPYNPAADPDLSQWVAPADDLHSHQVPARGHMETTTSGGINIFGWSIFQSSSSKWVWDVPPPTPINDWQKNQIDITTKGGWTSWAPPLWQLFFYSDNPATITAEDFPAIASHLNDLTNARHPSGEQPQTKSQNTLFMAPTGIPPTTGMNLDSPIWRGYPYGRYPDTRSIQGYFNNTDTTMAKIDITAAPDTNINKSYPYGSPFDGINKLLNGWISTYPVTIYTETQQQVLIPGTPGSGNPNHGSQEVPEHYETRIISTPTTTSHTVTQSPCVFPSAGAIITVPSSTRRMITKVTFGFAEITSSGGNAQGRGSSSSSYRSSTATWGTTNVEQTIDPATTLQINNFRGPSILDDGGASQIDAILADGVAKPVILVGANGSMGKPLFTIIAPIQKVQITVTTSVTHSFFGLFSWSTPSTSQQWVYQIDMAQGQGFSIDNDSNVISGVPLPLNYFASGDKIIVGVFFRLDARSLSSSDNIITAGWTGIGNIPNSVQGTAIATALLNPLWWDGSTFNRSPLCSILSTLKNIILSPAADILNTLSVLFSPNSAVIINSVVSQLSLETQNSSTIKSAVKTLTDSSPGTLLSQIEYLQASYTTFMSAVNNLINNPGIYSAGDIQTFYSQFPVMMGGLLSLAMKNALNAYLDILYSARLAIIPQRINKQTGTLINIARTEFALALMQDSLVTPPSLLDLFTPEKLPVVHETTNITLMNRATMVAQDLPIEKVQVVYVAVEYTDSGSVIRPSAGTYQFFSQEILNNPSLNPSEWYITFDASDSRCPNIIKDVITTIDGNKLQQVMVDTTLTPLEKICWARVLADWWEIPIPIAAQPLATDYVTSLQLVLAAPTATVDQYLQFLGGGVLSPILDSTTKLQVSPTAVADPKMQEILRARNA